MTVKIMDATLSFTCTLTNETTTMRPFGDRDKYYKDAIQFLEASDKAKEFIKKISASEHEFDIMITDQYFNKYFSPGELASIYATELPNKASLITWNAKENGSWFAIRANQPDEFSWVPGSHPSLANKVVPPPAILLMHEFGHGLQYLADKGGYEALRTASYQQPDGKDIDLRIENDNIRKHEAPVCLDLGQQVRWQYWDNTRPKGPPQYTPGVGHRVSQPYSGLGVGRKESIR
jgi:hypothetical protein